MSRKAKASEFVESLVPPAPPAPDEVVAKGLNIAGEAMDMVIENPLNKVSNLVRGVGNWLRSRTKGNL